MRKMRMIPLLAAAALAVVGFFVTGCNGTQWFENNKGPLEFAIKIAVIDMIDQEKVDGDRVIELASSAGEFVDANPRAKAEDIINYVRQDIKWDKLTAGQTVLAEAILGVLTEKIAADIERGLIDKDAKASVREIIGWIQEAAEMAKRYQPVSVVDDRHDALAANEGHRRSKEHNGFGGALAREGERDHAQGVGVVLALLGLSEGAGIITSADVLLI